MSSARKAEQDGSARLRLALPKGRLAKDLEPLLERVGLTPEAAFDDERERRLIYRTAQDGVEVLQAKPFDVATLVAETRATFKRLRNALARTGWLYQQVN